MTTHQRRSSSSIHSIFFALLVRLSGMATAMVLRMVSSAEFVSAAVMSEDVAARTDADLHRFTGQFTYAVHSKVTRHRSPPRRRFHSASPFSLSSVN